MKHKNYANKPVEKENDPEPTKEADEPNGEYKKDPENATPQETLQQDLALKEKALDNVSHLAENEVAKAEKDLNDSNKTGKRKSLDSTDH